MLNIPSTALKDLIPVSLVFDLDFFKDEEEKEQPHFGNKSFIYHGLHLAHRAQSKQKLLSIVQEKMEKSVILVQPFKGFADSIAAITEHAETEIEQAVSQILPNVLEKTSFDEQEKIAIINAAASRDFSYITLNDQSVLKAALLCTLISEQSRMEVIIHDLKNLSEENLAYIGMPVSVRDALVAVLPQLTASNTEYVRVISRGLKGKNRDPQPIDPIQEWEHLEEALALLIKKLQKSDFIQLKDGVGATFVEYLETIRQSFVAIDPETNEIYAKEKRDQLIDTAYEKFKIFYRENPDFPLIVLPASDTYINRGFKKASGEEIDLGIDPEIRIVWQAPQERFKGEKLEKVRKNFAENLLRIYPKFLDENDVENIEKTRIIVGQNLFAGGINLKYRAPAQRGSQAIFLFENTQVSEYNNPAIDKIEKLLSVSWHEYTRDPNFSELLHYLVILHELVHEIYPTESELSQSMFAAHDMLKETKSDTLARTVFYAVCKKEAQTFFGKDALAVLNLVLIADDLQTISTSGAEGESASYWVGAIKRVNVLLEQKIIITTKYGFSVHIEKLSQNIGELYIAYGEEIMDVYEMAKKGKPEKTTALAHQLNEVEPHELLGDLMNFLSNEELSIVG